MDITRTLTKITVGALLTASLAVPGSGFAAPVAHADDTFAPHHWCPGQTKYPPTGPGSVVWDWNVCHTFYFTNYGMGNVVIPTTAILLPCGTATTRRRLP